MSRETVVAAEVKRRLEAWELGGDSLPAEFRFRDMELAFGKIFASRGEMGKALRYLGYQYHHRHTRYGGSFWRLGNNELED